MSYKVLMVHLDVDDDGDGRVRLAAELAGRFGAALIGISAWAPSPAFGGGGAVIESAPELADLQVMEDLLAARGKTFRALVGKAAEPVEWRAALELPTEFVL